MCEVIFKVLTTFPHILTAPVKAVIKSQLAWDPTTHRFFHDGWRFSLQAWLALFTSSLTSWPQRHHGFQHLNSALHRGIRRFKKTTKRPEWTRSHQVAECWVPDTEPTGNPEGGRRRSRRLPRPPVSECDGRPSHQHSVTVPLAGVKYEFFMSSPLSCVHVSWCLLSVDVGCSKQKPFSVHEPELAVHEGTRQPLLCTYY